MKDKQRLLLPVIDALAIEADWDEGPDIAYNCAEAQRDADLLILQRDHMPKEQVKPILAENDRLKAEIRQLRQMLERYRIDEEVATK